MARATCQAVLDKFGSVAPFTNIVQSEATRIAALERLFNAYGLPIPYNEIRLTSRRVKDRIDPLAADDLLIPCGELTSSYTRRAYSNDS